MTVKPTLWQPSIVFVWSIIIGLCVVAAPLLPGGTSWLGLLLVLGVPAWAQTRGVRLEITAG